MGTKKPLLGEAEGSRRGVAACVSLGLDKQLLHRRIDTSNVLELLPVTATVDTGELALGGIPAGRLAADHGTPLVVYCEETIRAQARAYRDVAPHALVVFGTKAFANVELLKVLADEGVGADVST